MRSLLWLSPWPAKLSDPLSYSRSRPMSDISLKAKELMMPSVQFNRSVMSNSLRPHEPQHTSLPVHHQLPVYPNPCPLSRWCHPTISSSVVPFSSCPQSFPVSGFIPMSQLFTSGGQSTGALPSASVLPIISGWFPLGLTGLVSKLSKGFSRVFSSITFWKNHFFSAQTFLWSSSHICTWLLEKP